MSVRLLSCVALAATITILTACSKPQTADEHAKSAAAAAPNKEEVSHRIEEYFGKSVTPGIGLSVKDITPSQVPGWNKGTLEVTAGGNTQSMEFLVTTDGKYFISGEVTDLTVDPLKAVMQKIDLKDRPARGPDDAKVTIVEYSDFQCPFCSRGYQILETQVMPEYEGKVRLYFKYLPLKSIHPWAESAALAAECANRQSGEAFWKMYHAIFKAQHEINQDNLKEKVTQFAKDAGLDEAKFSECFEAKAGLPQVEQDLKEAAAVGANSTPTFFINGRRLEGAQPYENFKAIIDQELS